jgi:CO/xanthine dehydrogenase FAD-binding subunit
VLPVLPQGSGWAFEEFARRHGDFAMAGAAAVISIDSQRRCALSRLALAGAGPTPIRASSAEELLSGEVLTNRILEEAARVAAEQIDPDADLHASAEYRRQLIRVMATRALKRAARRAQGEGGELDAWPD